MLDSKSLTVSQGLNHLLPAWWSLDHLQCYGCEVMAWGCNYTCLFHISDHEHPLPWTQVPRVGAPDCPLSWDRALLLGAVLWFLSFWTHHQTISSHPLATSNYSYTSQRSLNIHLFLPPSFSPRFPLSPDSAPAPQWAQTWNKFQDRRHFDGNFFSVWLNHWVENIKSLLFCFMGRARVGRGRKGNIGRRKQKFISMQYHPAFV